MCIFSANQVQSCRIQQPFTEQTEFLQGGQLTMCTETFLDVFWIITNTLRGVCSGVWKFYLKNSFWIFPV